MLFHARNRILRRSFSRLNPPECCALPSADVSCVRFSITAQQLTDAVFWTGRSVEARQGSNWPAGEAVSCTRCRKAENRSVSAPRDTSVIVAIACESCILKTGDPSGVREFESRPFRQNIGFFLIGTERAKPSGRGRWWDSERGLAKCQYQAGMSKMACRGFAIDMRVTPPKLANSAPMYANARSGG